MTSITTYTEITPTYLYIKQHSITKKKYYGKTTKDPYTYNGSGPYWIDHINKHGKEYVVTIEVSKIYTDTRIVEDALRFSKDNNIVESNEWANQKPENGLDGGDTVSKKMWITNGISDKYLNKIDKIPEGWIRGRTNSKFNDSNFQKELSKRPRSEKTAEERKEIAQKGLTTRILRGTQASFPGDLNPSKRPEVRAKIKLAANNRPKIQCPHCDKIGTQSPGMYRWHFDNCKMKI